MATATTRGSRIRNPCCCGCSLFSSVGFIVVLEALFCIVGSIATFAIRNKAEQSYTKYRDPQTQSVTHEEQQEHDYFDIHSTTLSGTLGLFVASIVASSFLCMALSQRIIISCYIWAACALVATIGHSVMLALDQYPVTYTALSISLIRLYFIIVVHYFAMEIKEFPDGVPILVRDVPVIVDGDPIYNRPVATYAYPGAVGYGGGYPGYGYGYHDDGMGVVGGLALGMALGGGIGGGYYDDCYYDDCYF